MSDTTEAKQHPYLSYLRRLVWSVVFWFAATLLVSVLLVIFHFWAKPGSRWEWSWWADAFAVLTNLLVGALVSFFFYYLVVHYPEQRKKGVIKNNLIRMYRNIKRDILMQVVHASMLGGRRDLSSDQDTIERLMTPSGFRAAYEDGREGDEGFYAFENQMSYDTPQFREIVLNLHILSKQIEFVLHNYHFDDEKSFESFKRLELGLLRLQQSVPGYDESKELCRFVWEVFAGWSWIDGNRDYDVIEKMVGDI